MNPRVLIALTRDFPGIARLPRALKSQGLSVGVRSPAPFELQLTRFADARFTCSSDPRAAAEELRTHVQTHSYDMAIAADDPLLEALAQRAGEAWGQTFGPLAFSRTPPACLYSKSAFLNLIEHSGIDVPLTRVCRTREEAVQAAAEVGFPLIFKKDIGHSGSGVRKIFDAAELDACLKDADAAQPFLIQREIKGLTATADMLFDHGVPRAWVCSYASRTRNGPFGSSSVRQFVNLPGIEPILKKVGTVTGFHGMAGLDFIHEQPSGKLVLLEMNCRPTPGHALRSPAGIDFGKELRAMLKGAAPTAAMTVRKNPTNVPMFPEDFDRAITDRDWPGLCKWIFCPPYWRFMPWLDPRLFARYIADAFRRFGKWLRSTN